MAEDVDLRPRLDGGGGGERLPLAGPADHSRGASAERVGQALRRPVMPRRQTLRPHVFEDPAHHPG